MVVAWAANCTSLVCHLMDLFILILTVSISVTSAQGSGTARDCPQGTWRLDPAGECQPCGHCVNQTSAPTSCNPVGGSCSPSTCAMGYYGPRCLEECGQCLGGYRFCLANGSCSLGCMQGYQGELCQRKCDEGAFGENCQQTCGKCLGGVSACDSAVGSCRDGCLLGWAGLLCNLQCPGGRYGVNCNEKCGHCAAATSCDKLTGDCVGGCSAGYRGSQCTTRCPRHKWGKNCLQTCKGCKPGCTCDIFSGICQEVCTGPDVDEYGYGVESRRLSLRYEARHGTHNSRQLALSALLVSSAALLVGLATLSTVIHYKRRSDSVPPSEEADCYENIAPVYKKSPRQSK